MYNNHYSVVVAITSGKGSRGMLSRCMFDASNRGVISKLVFRRSDIDNANETRLFPKPFDSPRHGVSVCPMPIYSVTVCPQPSQTSLTISFYIPEARRRTNACHLLYKENCLTASNPPRDALISPSPLTLATAANVSQKKAPPSPVASSDHLECL